MNKLEDFLPVIVIPGWKRSFEVERLSKTYFGGMPFAVYDNINGLGVILTLEQNVWLHVSVSCPEREPSWYELISVKKIFMGDRFAVQFLPPEEHYINMHQHCLHLWCRVDDEPIVPDVLWKNPEKP